MLICFAKTCLVFLFLFSLRVSPIQKIIFNPALVALFIFELINLSIIDSIKPTSSINDDKINNMIKNVDKFSNDIKEWKMKKYYSRLQILLDKIIMDMINKIKK